MNEENKTMKQELAKVKKQNRTMRTELDEIKSKMNLIDQKKVASNVIVRGATGDGNPIEVMCHLASIVGIELQNDDFVFAKRSENKQDSMTVRFKSDSKKVEFVKAAKKKRLSTKMCDYEGEDKPIYVDEQLTQGTYELLAQAKALKKVGMKYVWTSNGNILCREKDDSHVIKISSAAQIQSIEKKMMSSNKKKKQKGKQSKAKPKQQSESEEEDFFTDADE